MHSGIYNANLYGKASISAQNVSAALAPIDPRNMMARASDYRLTSASTLSGFSLQTRSSGICKSWNMESSLG